MGLYLKKKYRQFKPYEKGELIFRVDLKTLF